MKQQYAPWIRDAVPIGFAATYVGVYLASEVDARIAELEHQLDIRKAAIDAQFRLMERVNVLEKALRWHVPTSHDKFCDVQEGKPQCNCGFDLLNRAL